MDSKSGDIQTPKMDHTSFTTKKKHLFTSGKTGTPAEDIIASLLSDGSWAECAGFDNEWMHLTKHPD